MPDTRRRSFPFGSICASSVKAGTCFNSRNASNRRSRRSHRPGQLGRPAQLAFDFLDELTDLRRGRLGLLVLNPDQRGLVLPIIEENRKYRWKAAPRDHGDEQRDIFGEQPAPGFGGRTTSRQGRRSCRRRSRQRPVLGGVGVEGDAHPVQASKKPHRLVSCRSAGTSFDDLVPKQQHSSILSSPQPGQACPPQVGISPTSVPECGSRF